MSTSSQVRRFAYACLGISLVILSGSARSQCIDSWKIRFGTSNDDQIRATARDSGGNTYLGGFEDGFLGVENWWPVGNTTGFVEKWSTSGALLWRYDFDSPDTDIVESIALDSTGRVVVAGRTAGAFPGQTNAGQFDLFLGLLDAEGNLLALKQFGDERPQHPVAVTPLQDGSIVVAGYDDIFVLGNAVIDWENGFVARFQVDASNTITQAWWLQPDLPQSDLVTGIAAAADGSSDFFVGDLNVTSPANGGGVHVKRIDAQGNDVWVKTISSISADYISSVAVSSEGRLFVAGTTLGEVAGPSLGNSDGFVVELDPSSGAVLGGSQVGTAGGDWIYSMSVDSSGTIYLTGETNEGLTAAYQGDGSYGPFALGLSASGSILGVWQPNPPTIFAADETLLIAPSGCNGTVVLAGSALLGSPDLPIIGREDAVALTIPLVDSLFYNAFDSFIAHSSHEVGRHN